MGAHVELGGGYFSRIHHPGLASLLFPLCLPRYQVSSITPTPSKHLAVSSVLYMCNTSVLAWASDAEEDCVTLTSISRLEIGQSLAWKVFQMLTGKSGLWPWDPWIRPWGLTPQNPPPNFSGDCGGEGAKLRRVSEKKDSRRYKEFSQFKPFEIFNSFELHLRRSAPILLQMKVVSVFMMWPWLWWERSSPSQHQAQLLFIGVCLCSSECAFWNFIFWCLAHCLTVLGQLDKQPRE